MSYVNLDDCDGANRASGRRPLRRTGGLKRRAAPLPLLAVSHLMPLTSSGRLVVRIQRACLEQRFGVSFEAAEKHNRQIWRIVVAGDLQHMGIQQGDVLIAINGTRPTRASEVHGILSGALSLDLVLQRTVDLGGRPFPARAVWLLLVAPAAVRDAELGEFEVSLHRSSKRQPFGLHFRVVPSRAAPGESTVLVSEDLPHLALRGADRIISLNGMRARSRRQCLQVLTNSTSVHLVLQRDTPKLELDTPKLQRLTLDQDRDDQAPPPALDACMGLDCVDDSHELALPGRNGDAGPLSADPLGRPHLPQQEPLLLCGGGKDQELLALDACMGLDCVDGSEELAPPGPNGEELPFVYDPLGGAHRPQQAPIRCGGSCGVQPVFCGAAMGGGDAWGLQTDERLEVPRLEEPSVEAAEPGGPGGGHREWTGPDVLEKAWTSPDVLDRAIQRDVKSVSFRMNFNDFDDFFSL